MSGRIDEWNLFIWLMVLVVLTWARILVNITIYCNLYENTCHIPVNQSWKHIWNFYSQIYNDSVPYLYVFKSQINQPQMYTCIHIYRSAVSLMLKCELKTLLYQWQKRPFETNVMLCPSISKGDNDNYYCQNLMRVEIFSSPFLAALEGCQLQNQKAVTTHLEVSSYRLLALVGGMNTWQLVKALSIWWPYDYQ